MKIKVRLLADVEDLGKKGEIVEIDEGDFNEKLHSKDLEQKSKSNPGTTTAAGDEAKARKRAVDDALEADLAHAAEVRRIAKHYNLDEMWSQRHIKMNTEIEQVLADATEARAKLAPVLDGHLSVGEDRDSIPFRMERMAQALAARAMRKEMPDLARDYADFSIAECAYEFLTMNGRTAGRMLDPRRQPSSVIKEALALHTTSDFTQLLENTLNKTLQPAYELAMPTFRRFARSVTFRDLRPHKFLNIGDFPNLLEVGEHGEFKSGTMTEKGEAVTAVTYGRILGLSRQILINDDVGAFQDFGAAVSRRVIDFESTTFYSLCILPAAGLGPTLTEGAVAVYNAGHNNVTGAGALSNTLLGSAWALLQKQTSLDGLKMNTEGRYVLTSPDSYVLSRTLLADITPNQASQVNAFAGMLTPLSDANLTGTRFYVLAEPPMSNYVYGTLEGQAAPFTEVRAGFEVDGIQIKVRHDFGAGATEFRYGVTGAGA